MQKSNNESDAVREEEEGTADKGRDRKVWFISPLPAGCPERWLKKAPVPSAASLAAATGGKERERDSVTGMEAGKEGENIK